MAQSLDLSGIVKRHQADVWRYLRVLGCEPALADDLTQETFVEVFLKPFDDYHPAATGAYLRKVAKHLFLMQVRKAAARPAVDNLDGVDPEWAAWAKDRKSEDDGGQRRLRALEQCLEELDERPRRAVELRYREHASREDMARELGMAETGVKTLLQRAREGLRHCIEERERERERLAP